MAGWVVTIGIRADPLRGPERVRADRAHVVVAKAQHEDVLPVRGVECSDP